jgi:hypothetical protein
MSEPPPCFSLDSTDRYLGVFAIELPQDRLEKHRQKVAARLDSLRLHQFPSRESGTPLLINEHAIPGKDRNTFKLPEKIISTLKKQPPKNVSLRNINPGDPVYDPDGIYIVLNLYSIICNQHFLIFDLNHRQDQSSLEAFKVADYFADLGCTMYFNGSGANASVKDFHIQGIAQTVSDNDALSFPHGVADHHFITIEELAGVYPYLLKKHKLVSIRFTGSNRCFIVEHRLHGIDFLQFKSFRSDSIFPLEISSLFDSPSYAETLKRYLIIGPAGLEMTTKSTCILVPDEMGENIISSDILLKYYNSIRHILSREEIWSTRDSWQ